MLTIFQIWLENLPDVPAWSPLLGKLILFLTFAEMLSMAHDRGISRQSVVSLILGGILIHGLGDLPCAHAQKTTRREHAQSNNQTQHSKAMKKISLTGKIVDIQGRPLIHAKVFLYGEKNPLMIHQGRIDQDSFAPFVTTDARGRFSFLPQNKWYGLATVNDQGYVIASDEEFKKNSILKLTTWGRVEGKLLIGDKPGANEEVTLSLADMELDRINFHHTGCPYVIFDYDVPTDEHGHFHFERAAAGLSFLAKMIKKPDVRDAYSIYLPMEVKAGETVRVTLGGSGLPVIGRLKAPKGQTIEWGKLVKNGWLSKIQPEPPIPVKLKNKTSQDPEVIKWYDQWKKSEAYKVYLMEERHYDCIMESNGLFHAEDVDPGDYRLYVILDPPDKQYGAESPIAELRQDVKIPLKTGGYGDKSFDLGMLELTMILTSLKAGDPMADFKVQTLDGMSLALADYRGKFVLLNFWASYEDACKDEIPYLKILYKAYKSDPRLMMIGLALDSNSKTPREYAKENGMNWIQGFLDGNGGRLLPKGYKIYDNDTPAIFLIGPDGRIVAKDLHRTQIMEAVKKALNF